MIYAASYDEEIGFSINTPAGRQLIWIGISFFLLFFIMVFEVKIWRTFSYVFYVIGILLLITVIFGGTVVNGQRAWFDLGFFSFQPSEIAKFGTALAAANLLSDYKIKLNQTSSAAIAVGLIMLPPALIMFQPDAGSALVFFSFFILYYRAGLEPNLYIIGLSLIGLFVSSLYFGFPITYLFILVLAMFLLTTQLQNRTYFIIGQLVLLVGGFIGIRAGSGLEILISVSILFLLLTLYLYRHRKTYFTMFVTVLVIGSGLLSFFSDFAFQNFLEPHQQERLNVWLHPEKCDPRGALYNVLQSKLAIGSGGLAGKGFLNGTLTKLNYVPAQTTDFIFCTVGEEFGFIGSFVVIALFLVLLLRLTIMAERQKLNFARFYIWGVTGIIFFHFLINISMTMGLLPIIGIPLPMVSYGGSSLMGFTVLLGVAIKLDSMQLTE